MGVRTPLETDLGSTNETELDEIDDAETHGASLGEIGSFGTVIDEAALAASSTADIPVGERYVDEELLGRGGMGWLRHDRQIGRQVAIKTLRKDKQTDRARAVLARGADPGPARAPQRRAGLRSGL